MWPNQAEVLGETQLKFKSMISSTGVANTYSKSNEFINKKFDLVDGVAYFAWTETIGVKYITTEIVKIK